MYSANHDDHLPEKQVSKYHILHCSECNDGYHDAKTDTMMNGRNSPVSPPFCVHLKCGIDTRASLEVYHWVFISVYSTYDYHYSYNYGRLFPGQCLSNCGHMPTI